MTEIKYIYWHVGSHNPWFDEFESKMIRLYSFDTSAGVGGSVLDWELDFMKPADRKLLVTDVMKVVKQYNLMTALRKRHSLNDTLEIFMPRREAVFTVEQLMERMGRLR